MIDSHSFILGSRKRDLLLFSVLLLVLLLKAADLTVYYKAPKGWKTVKDNRKEAAAR